MTTPTLQTRLGYVALMMCGVGRFVVLGIVLLVTAGGWDLHRRLLTVHESEPADNETAQSSINSEGIELTETERALIRLLRTNDVPPDAVAEAIREVMERRMGR